MKLANSWKLVGSFNWVGPTQKALPVTVRHNFTNNLIKTETSVTGVPARWYRAGYLRQVVNLVPAEETSSVVVPLNSRKVLPFPLLTNSYQLIFIPVDYLPSGLKLKVWEYTGSVDAELLSQFYLSN